MSTGWDNATLKKLKALTGKGLSTSEMGKKLGMSKNAIVGKLNRLGWNAGADGKPKPETSKAAVKKTITIASKKTLVAKPSTKKATTATSVAEKKIVQLSKVGVASPKNLAMHQRIVQHSMGMAGLKHDQCRWPIGDPDSENFHFCGNPVFAGKPYCYEHCKQAYQFTPAKKK